MSEEMVPATLIAFGPLRYTHCVIEAYHGGIFESGSGYWSDTDISWWHVRPSWRWFKREIQIPKEQAVIQMYADHPPVRRMESYQPPC